MAICGTTEKLGNVGIRTDMITNRQKQYVVELIFTMYVSSSCVGYLISLI